MQTSNPRFAGIFSNSPGGYVLYSYSDWTAFMAQNTQLANQGWRLFSVSCLVDLGIPWFYGVWAPGPSGAYGLLRTSNWNELYETFRTNQGKLRMTDVNVTTIEGVTWYIGAWLTDSTTPQMLLQNLTGDALGAQWSDLSTNHGMRLTKLQAYSAADQSRYVALFEAGGGGYLLLSGALEDVLKNYLQYSTSLALTSFDVEPVTGLYTGVWRQLTATQYFVHDLDWNTFATTAGQLLQEGLALRAITAYPGAPPWHDYFAENLKPYVRGYAWAVAQNGVVVSEGVGLARGPNESVNKNAAITPDTRYNVASVSKTITAIAMQLVMAQKNISVDSPLYPLIASRVPNPDKSILPVTLRNLLTMESGMTGDGSLGGTDLWVYINQQLSQPLTGTPGQTYNYENSNFTILQGVIEQLSGMTYADFVSKYVLTPMGINTAILSVNPDPQATAGLNYAGPKDTQPGTYWQEFDFQAPGGWISSVNELVKVLIGLRNNSTLSASETSAMFTGQLGWYTTPTPFGDCYQHNGALATGGTPPQGMNSVLIHFPEGYDLALISNSPPPDLYPNNELSLAPPDDVSTIAINAYQSRGFATAPTPDLPVIYTLTNGASFLPDAAPGAFVTITGAQFGAKEQTWSNAIPDGKTLPVTLGGVSVEVDGRPCYLYYVSDTQLNVLLPSSLRSAVLDVEVTTAKGVATFTAPVQPVAPGLFPYQLQGISYAVALFANTAIYVAQPGAVSGFTSRPAKAGDLVQLYANGLGLTSPAIPDGQVLTKAYPINDLSRVTVTVGGRKAVVQFVGLVFAGVFQVNIQMPGGLSGGNAAVVLSIDGVASQNNLVLAVQA